ncbi:hypothetical protein AAGG74_17475 [Bacillus mexicanus]|uniref:hypothetical protein n=1 Tax=Bacillus mexicanus TaxID=2834415 RepID=UPI003D22A6AC
MRKRNSGYYRHHRERVIKKKLNILKNVWKVNGDNHPWIECPGKLSKAKLNCSCKLCKYEKHYEIPTSKNKSKLDIMKKDIKSYLEGDFE